jgi:hypothetical protein
MPSSVIKSMDYDAAAAVLKIIFVSGVIYEYKNVPENVYQSMKSSSSKGTYLNTHIKNNFEYKKLN